MRQQVTDPPVNQSVERAARMLELFSVDEPELTLTELTALNLRAELMRLVLE